jgi:hypothetical protein
MLSALPAFEGPLLRAGGVPRCQRRPHQRTRLRDGRAQYSLHGRDHKVSLRFTTARSLNAVARVPLYHLASPLCEAAAMELRTGCSFPTHPLVLFNANNVRASAPPPRFRCRPLALSSLPSPSAKAQFVKAHIFARASSRTAGYI